jgi:hypothetical protein
VVADASAAMKKEPEPETRSKPVKKRKKKKRRRKKKPAAEETRVAMMEEEPPKPPPPREEKKPRRKKVKGGLLDFEDEKEFAAVTGGQKPISAKVEAKPKKELPPLSNADVMGVMRQHLAEFKACNRKQKSIDPSVRGRMVVTFVIKQTGRVSKVTTTTDRFKSTYVSGCTAKVIRQIRFPEFGGKPKRVPFPFTVK